MSRYAEKTQVSADRSKAEIERTLMRYGATQFMYGWGEQGVIIGFRVGGKMYRVDIPMPQRHDPKLRAKASNQYVEKGEVPQAAYDQAVMQRWRAAALFIKATLEAVEAGITTLEQVLLANLLLPDGETFGQWAAPHVEQMYLTGAMPPLLPGLPSPREEK